MTNQLLLIAAAWVILGLGHIAALLGVLFRWAIPRAPLFFHALLFTPMTLASTSCFFLSWMAFTGEQTVIFDALTLLTIFIICEATWLWVLVAYAVYHWRRGRRCPV